MQRYFDADERVQVNAHPSTINNHVERHLQPVSYQRTKIEQIMESNSSLIISTRANNSLSDKLRGRSNITRVPTYYYTWCNGQGTPTIRSVGRISFGTPRKGLVCLTRPPLPTLDRRIHEHVVMPTSSSGHGKPRMKARRGVVRLVAGVTHPYEPAPQCTHDGISRWPIPTLNCK